MWLSELELLEVIEENQDPIKALMTDREEWDVGTKISFFDGDAGDWFHGEILSVLEEGVTRICMYSLGACVLWSDVGDFSWPGPWGLPQASPPCHYTTEGRGYGSLHQTVR